MSGTYPNANCRCFEVAALCWCVVDEYLFIKSAREITNTLRAVCMAEKIEETRDEGRVSESPRARCEVDQRSDGEQQSRIC